MTAQTLMVQGTASSVGKSMLVTALCRILKQDGWKVAPFKAQNMSLNSFATRDGGEIGRAQAVQAEAAGVEPAVEMNPILLKPESDRKSQVVVKGRVLGTASASGYGALEKPLWAAVTESLEHLLDQYEAVVIEGAGSPAEINLKSRDIVNMRVALHCRAPVILVADIDRGGVFASIVGTLELLEPEERALIKMIVINKFRGDLSLLEPGIRWLEDRTWVPVAGVLPYDHYIRVAEEDSLSLERRQGFKEKRDTVLDIAVIGLPHISNFDDFDPLERETEVRLRYVENGNSLGAPDLIILPGTKSTVSDLEYLRRRGLAGEIIGLARAGTPVIGICGGYQIMGEVIFDPDRVESSQAETAGLAMLPVRTTFFPGKSTHQVAARVILSQGLLEGTDGFCLSGYEIHMGQTERAGSLSPFRIDERSRTACDDADGCLSADGLLLGTYIHGLFHNEGLRRALLNNLAARKGVVFHPSARVISKEAEYDRLAALVRSHLDMAFVYRILGSGKPSPALSG